MMKNFHFLRVMENEKAIARSVKIFVLLFLVAVSISSTKTASASMTVDELSAFAVTPQSFSGLFHANVPITDGSRQYWDYYLTPSTMNGDPAYNAVLYNTYSGAYATGNGSVIYHDYDDSHVYILSYPDVTGTGAPYGYATTDSGVQCAPGGDSVHCAIMTDQGASGLLGTSQDILYTDHCDSNNWNSGTYVQPSEYLMCGTWNPSCSPILTASSQCGGTTPPVANVGSTCTAPFANVPSIIDDPLGFITSIWSGIGNWFSCLFQDSLNYIANLFTTLSSSLVTAFSNATQGIATSMSGILQTLFIPESTFWDTQLASMKTEFTTQFADVWTFYDAVKSAHDNSSFQSHFSGNLSYRGHAISMSVSPFENVPSYVPVITSFVALLSLGWFLIEKIPEIFG